MDKEKKFFDDILDDEDGENKLQNETEETELTENDEVVGFDFESDIPSENYKTDYDKIDNYNRTKEDIKDSVAELQSNINSMLDKISTKPEDMFPDKDLLPNLDIQVEYHDYEKDIELIKIESKETLECLANLYLTEKMMNTKNIYKIIKDDSMNLAKLNFSIEMSQRAMISCMRQLDMGVNDPDMYQSVALFQKELRDSIKMAYDLQKKMKDFYKELKSELQEIDTGDEITTQEESNYIIGDPKMLNNLFEQMKNDPTLLNDMLNKDKKNDDKKD
ncbi:MAG: hypothetical protein HPY57_14930 [Ignavibacteria bacterium]|nr:hypothetical protein [Ignavibacteria bacterium]